MSRNWITQLKGANGCQIGNAKFSGNITSAKLDHHELSRPNWQSPVYNNEKDVSVIVKPSDMLTTKKENKVMAKKETRTPTSPVEDPKPKAATDKMAAVRAARQSASGDSDNDMFVATGLKIESAVKKLAPQAQIIVNTIASQPDGITRKELYAKLAVPGVIKSVQPIGRLVTYYQKPLIEAGHITLTKAAAPAAAPAA